MIHRLTDRIRWAGKRVRDTLLSARKVVLGVGGCGLIDAAIWVNSMTWGMVAAGATLLLFQFLTEGDDKAVR